MNKLPNQPCGGYTDGAAKAATSPRVRLKYILLGLAGGIPGDRRGDRFAGEKETRLPARAKNRAPLPRILRFLQDKWTISNRLGPKLDALESAYRSVDLGGLDQHTPAQLVNGTTGGHVWAERFETMQAKGYGFDRVYVSDPATVYDEAGWPLNILGDQREKLRAQVERLEAIAVIIDTIRETHGGDENDSSHMLNVLA